MTEDERDLLRRAQLADAAAFECLVRRYQAEIRGFLLVRMRDAHEAEDLAQETFITAYRRLADFDTTRPLGPWLRGIARGLLANFQRKKRALPLSGEDDLELLLDREMARREGEGERLLALGECLAQLDGEARSLLWARYGRGEKLAEMARVLRLKSSALSMKLHRLRGGLAACVRKKCGLFEESESN